MRPQNPQQIALAISEASQAGEARRAATAMAGELGFNETERGKVAIVASEAARNLAKHAKQGELILSPLFSPVDSSGQENNGIELIAVDRGPGMHDIERCLEDGFSTAGTPGTGLGAMRRLSQQFDVFSLPGAGTAMMMRLWAKPSSQPATGPFDLGVISIPYPGEDVCGDGWAIHQSGDRWLMMVTDGLGHGLGAAHASREAERIFADNVRYNPAQIVQAAHGALRSTRGAAVAVVEIELARRELRFSGIGNISGSVTAPSGAFNLVSHNGTVGHTMHRVQEFAYPWPTGGLIVLHSDGLSTHWNLDTYRGLAFRHPAVIAGMLYRHHRRGKDDATILVARERGDSP